MPDAARYLCVIRLDGAERVVLWKEDDHEPARLSADEHGVVLAFASVDSAREAAQANGWKISTEEPTLYDLDRVERWCRSDAVVRDCTELLTAWNLLVDLPDSENLFRAADARALGVYDKLFRACNLPSVTPPGEHYAPVWTAPETAALKHLLLLGIAELRARIR